MRAFWTPIVVWSSVTAHPLTSDEKNAVGEALGQALGVMTGKIKSGDKFSICSNMFPDGAPADAAKDASWQACKDTLPSENTYSSLLSWKQAVIARGGATQPLTAHQKQAVGDALSSALGVLSGKAKSGDKWSICRGLFPEGAPANAATDASWQACKSEFVGSFLSKQRGLVRQPLTTQERDAVGAALSNALGVLSGKVKSGDKFSICSNLFPDGPPSAPATDATWQACKDELPSMQKYSSLISWQHAVRAAGGSLHPLTSSEKEAVGAELSKALGVLSGKVTSGSKASICAEMFPNGAPPDAASSPTWQSCKGVVGWR
jgi:hypothetical protein